MSADITRRLQSYALRRQQSIDVGLEYLVRTKNADGTFSNTSSITAMQGFFTMLNDYDIKRLNEGGVTVAEGATLSLSEELTNVPDVIYYDKIDSYSYGKKAKVIRHNIAEGATVLTLDTVTLNKR